MFGPTTELWEKTQLHSRGPDESAPETNGQQLPGSLSASAAKINMCRGNAPVKWPLHLLVDCSFQEGGWKKLFHPILWYYTDRRTIMWWWFSLEGNSRCFGASSIAKSYPGQDFLLQARVQTLLHTTYTDMIKIKMTFTYNARIWTWMEIFVLFWKAHIKLKSLVGNSRLHFGRWILTLVTNTDDKLQTERCRYQSLVSLLCRNLFIEIIDSKAV